MLIVFRYGHRIIRDKRLTTHVALVSRAFLADKMIYSGDKDRELEQRIDRLKQIKKPKFRCVYSQDWEEDILKLKKEGFTIVHLTMYGESILKKELELKQKQKIVVVVGSQKVPPKLYTIADYNISITKYPHSEAGALAVFLNEINDKNALLE